MITSRKNALEWFEALNVAYWYLYPGKDTNSGNWVKKSSDSEAATPADAMRELEQTFHWIDSGLYTIVATDTAKNTPKGKFIMQVNLSRLEQTGQQQGSGQQVIQGIPEDQVEKRIAAAVDAAMQKLEMKKLQAEVEQLRKENKELEDNSPFAKLAGIAVDLAPSILPHILGVKAPVAQVAGLNAIPPADHVQQAEVVDEVPAEVLTDMENRVNAIIETLSSIDPTGWLDKLEMLASKVKANPNLLTMIKIL